MGSPVRIATKDDEPEVIRLLEMMHAESGLRGLDLDCARNMFAFAFEKRGGIIGAIGPKDSIEGMIFLLITRFWYRKDNHLEELFNYVRPDHRAGTDHAKTLIEFAKKCADEIKIPLAIGVMTNQRVVGKVRLYRRSLGFPSGAFWIYGAEWANERTADDDDFWQKPFPSHIRNGRARKEVTP